MGLKCSRVAPGAMPDWVLPRSDATGPGNGLVGRLACAHALLASLGPQTVLQPRAAPSQIRPEVFVIEKAKLLA